MKPAEKPRLTIVIPTRNSGKTLRWTLLSILGPGGPRGCQVVVADSDSTDDTLSVCKQWLVPVVQVPAGHLYRAVNVGMNMADTEWLAYVNSDDLIYPAAYSDMLKSAMSSEADVVYGRGDFIDGDNRFLHSQQLPTQRCAVSMLALGVMPFVQPSAIFRRRSFAEMGGFDEHYRHVGDLDFYCRLMLRGHHFLRYPYGSVVAFRLHAGQLSRCEATASATEQETVIRSLNLKPSSIDQARFGLWKLSNTASYCFRMWRYYTLSKRLAIPRALSTP
jgi:glycosyltransferase involved in cell wall biosynthesis